MAPLIYYGTHRIFLLTAWVNVANFMDGINGLTALYALTAIVSFAALPTNVASLPLLMTMGLSCLAFGIFNVRKNAKIFAGDVGSISMALFLGYFMVKSISNTGLLGYMLFFSVYAVDSGATILSRLIKRQNIFQAHRSHLYQYLVNEMGYSHIFVASLYAGLQLLVNSSVVYMASKGKLTSIFTITFLLLLTFFYLFLRMAIVWKIENKNL